MVSPSRISRAAVQALKKESFICEPMSAPGFVMLGAGYAKEASLREIILRKTVLRE